ncbi:MAG: hypothetical protein KBA17_04355 [Aliarcobacter sp.]|jgi:inactivated superfamily I helicase|nr:hypothetical protein [Aliarcobacter sp.]
MNFNDLDLKTKKELHEEVTQLATDIGGANVFLQMIEDIKKEQPHALLNKSCVFHFSKAKLNWNKQIFKESLTQLFSAMRKEEREGDMLNGLESKDYKETMNMMRTLKPITIRVTPKKNEELRGFAFSILDTSVEKKTKVSMIYKIIFFYHIEFAKDILAYEIVEN